MNLDVAAPVVPRAGAGADQGKKNDDSNGSLHVSRFPKVFAWVAQSSKRATISGYAQQAISFTRPGRRCH